MLLLVTVAPIRAQDTGVPLEIGDIVQGSVTAADPAANFLLTVNAPQPVRIEVLSLSDNFAPTFNVLDAAGMSIQAVSNSAGTGIVEGTTHFPSAGLYSIEVRSATGLDGAFALSLRAGQVAPPPAALVPGQPLTGTVSAQTSIQTYAFIAETQVLLLNVWTELPSFGPVITLRNGMTGDVVAQSSAQLIGIRHRIPAGTVAYQRAPCPCKHRSLQPSELNHISGLKCG